MGGLYVLAHSRYYLAENAENVVAGRAIQMRTGRGRLLDAGFRVQSLTTTLAESSRRFTVGGSGGLAWRRRNYRPAA
jgi:hypothetical protein